MCEANENFQLSPIHYNFKNMIFKFFFTLGIVLSISFLHSDDKTMDSEKRSLIINMENQEILPRNFRMTREPYIQEKIRNPTLYGLSELQASASGQFSEKSLSKILETVPGNKILLVDLRKESHGFVNGIAISWYEEKNWSNIDKSLEEILMDESQLHKKALENKYIKLYQKNLDNYLLVDVKEAYTEKELAEKMGIHYIRIPITDHLKPQDSDVDHFVELIKTHFLPVSDFWIHFHCSAGRGRSTTFISMYDMMRNAANVSFEDILARQVIMGGKDLLQPFDGTDWRYDYHFERLRFLMDFYNYCLENPKFKQSWSSWITHMR